MSRRHRSSWWWRRRSGGAADTPDVDALLNEAAVRFDFSQYSDIDDMVDVNGGWGPFVVNSSQSTEFTADGMRVTGDPGNEDNLDVMIEVTESPIVFGPDGVTIVSVVRAAEAISNQIAFTLVGDGGGAYAPGFDHAWNLNVGAIADGRNDSLWDNPPGDPIFETGTVAIGDAGSSTGTLIQVSVIDPANHETRLTYISPAYDTVTVTVPFNTPTPLFASSPTSADTLYLTGLAGATDVTFDEWAAWNRGLTPDEVDLLVAHFTA